MVFDSLFSKKPGNKATTAPEAGPTNLSAEDEQSLDRKSQRMERRELLYAVVRESMARVGVLSSSYKYKVLSLDSRGSQYLIMMDLPREMAEHIEQLAEIEESITQTALARHKINVTAVYWRINELAKSSVMRKHRPEAEKPSAAAVEEDFPVFPQPPQKPGESGARRYEPIRPDEVNAFKQALASGIKEPQPASKPPAKSGSKSFAPSNFPPTEFQPTQMINEEEVERTPLSRTQYGDLI